jgi:hypothetical protein
VSDRGQRQFTRPWSLIATSPLTTIQIVQGVQCVSVRGKNRPHTAQCTYRAVPNRVEGLAPDNRVKVRVLFRRPRPIRSSTGPTFRDNASGDWGIARFPQCSPQLGGRHARAPRAKPGPLGHAVARTWQATVANFATEAEAQALDHEQNPPRPSYGDDDPSRPARGEAADTADHGGVHTYTTSEGTPRRFVYRESDGRLTTQRGLMSRTAAVAGRSAAVEEVRH